MTWARFGKGVGMILVGVAVSEIQKILVLAIGVDGAEQVYEAIVFMVVVGVLSAKVVWR